MNFKEKQLINDKYEIIRFIDTGGTSKVYLAKDLLNNEERILKVIKINNQEEKDKILNELKIYNLISRQKNQSQYIMNLFEHFILSEEDQDYFVFVVEYIKGITLRKYLDQHHALSYIKAVEIIRQIALGVLFLHNLTPKVIHRDLKPENCMIDESRTGIKIIDLGAASALFLDKQELTKYNTFDCTILYASPVLIDLSKINKELKKKEIQRISDSKNITEIINVSFDIHALGIIFYELIASNPPFIKENENEKDVDFLKNWIKYDFLPVSVINPNIPIGIDNILVKCFATKRHTQFRYKNINQLIQDLENVLDENHEINQKRLVALENLNLKHNHEAHYFKQNLQQKIFLSKWFVVLIIFFCLMIVIILGVVIGLKESGII